MIGKGNKFISTNGSGIELKSCASITIEGKGKDNAYLEITLSQSSGSGGTNYIGIGANGTGCKDITINKIAITVNGGKTESTQGNDPAAIGIGNIHDNHNQTCGDITITESKVIATSYGGACIGTGFMGTGGYSSGHITMGSITIANCEIKTTANNNN